MKPLSIFIRVLCIILCAFFCGATEQGSSETDARDTGTIITGVYKSMNCDTIYYATK